jgi:hypothetical protein
MDYITTTQLRTQSKALVSALKSGKQVKLIHRSNVIGKILPLEEKSKVKINPAEFEEFIKRFSAKLPNLTPAQRERNYRQHLEGKYGQHLSRR